MYNHCVGHFDGDGHFDGGGHCGSDGHFDGGGHCGTSSVGHWMVIFVLVNLSFGIMVIVGVVFSSI